MDICPGVVLLTGLFDYDEEYGAIGTGPRPTVTKKCLVSNENGGMDGWNLEFTCSDGRKGKFGDEKTNEWRRSNSGYRQA